MIDWLKRNPRTVPEVRLGDRQVPIVVRRLPQAKRMTLRLAPDGSEVRVSIPKWGRTDDALAFARSRATWLAGQLSAIVPAQPLLAGGVVPYRGEILVIEHRPEARRRPVAGAGAIRLGGPAESLCARLQRWLQSEARELMREDLGHYCARAGMPMPSLALSSAQRRWGSCSPGGTIRINWRLVMAPDFVRRSVVAHEVAHLVHFDHSRQFHACLGELFEGDIAEANRWLKREGRTLYSPFG